MKITPDLSAPMVHPDDSTTIPSRLLVEDELEGVALEMTVEVNRWGHGRCSRLVFAAPGGDIDWKVLRVPLSRLVAEATAWAGAQFGAPKTTSKGVTRYDFPPADSEARYERLARNARLPRRGSPITDDHLHAVAELYREMVENGYHPRPVIASEWGVSEAAASKWIAMARERGILPPTQQGRISV